MSLSPHPIETALKTLETKAEDSIFGVLSPPVAEKRQQEPDFLRQCVGCSQEGILAIPSHLGTVIYRTLFLRPDECFLLRL
jgi:hypothetical protein